MLVFIEERASTNICLRMMCSSVDTQRIDRYYQRLMFALDKFQVRLESIIKYSSLLLTCH